MYFELYLAAIKGEVSKKEEESMGTLHSAHKYVNAIQEGNEALKDIHRQSSSCVPANSPPVVRIIASTDRRKIPKDLFSHNYIYVF